MKRSVLAVVAFLLGAALTSALTLSETILADDNYPLPIDPDSYGEDWNWADTDDNGTLDYAFKLSDRGDVLYEVMDFNDDGVLDNFYYRTGGLLVQQDLDTNFDGEIDLWILMEDGVHVRGYLRDVDFDGQVDVDKDYGE